MQESLLPKETLARPAHYLQTGQNSKVWTGLEPTFCLMTNIKWARKYRPDQNQSYSTKLQSQVKVNLCVKTKLCLVFVILALFWLIESIHLITVPCINGFLWTGGTAKLISLVVFHLILQFLPTMAERQTQYLSSALPSAANWHNWAQAGLFACWRVKSCASWLSLF